VIYPVGFAPIALSYRKTFWKQPRLPNQQRDLLLRIYLEECELYSPIVHAPAYMGMHLKAETLASRLDGLSNSNFHQF
jgi:hypothetical protein